MKSILLWLNLLVCLPVFAQGDTTFVDGRRWNTSRIEARYFYLPVKKEGDLYKVQYFYLSGKLYLDGYHSSPDAQILEGYATYYNENGTKSRYGNYKENKEVGVWTFNYDDTDLVHCLINLTNRDDTSEILSSFYRSGKLKRKQWTRKGKTRGKCYAEDGNEIKFTPYEIMPKPGYYVEGFLLKNMKYPVEARRAKIEGRVIVTFVLMEDGKVDSVKIEKSVHPALDSEALRVVSKMPPWSPGVRDDEPTKVYFTFPIMFKLPW